ncbi:type II CRISPR-associated endonuclease Cas1 [Companilactobacillus sp.]|jgi:CRISPR-associated protein Cas1|uniref:type II CRISPR-associated endonuclease Cas1 n=1 Tax=Companilactobacillus sp. TaxID=2767905 RepID=UPI0025C556BA|nr:type II CRISPR-associated endonuclease Cas1 [Companilactobacillus sp.]MCH4010267.1 type II CRISPR-associated endonuclease Cas1 [Companilactobacillus sp.]MCH4052057.1 type II CRISPR-associated endonuclease Cas1 [Companilactobacillus sp.]MCH4078209.1 type II CRISPR-associated endonuclease Cas1 [Companilactobacillus sp.]MCH4126785.1 type II CRISPR-associated endonuclease Cas1 [Companilactobacillus sp.]MCH4132370.1 type II CRISPR-associated endonuclease Cas1 [Companilactobacillus sp.]
MAWRIVHVKEGDYLRLRLDNLEITKLDKKVYVPLSDVSMVVLEGNRTSITTKLLSSMSQHNVGLVICDDKYLPVGMYLPYGQYHHNSKRVIIQSNWDRELKQRAWKNIISQKMANQISYARFVGVEQDRIELMVDLLNGLQNGDVTNREGHLAKVYFDSLYGKTFTRDDENFENSAMNFGYAILRSCVARLIVGNGLITMLGIFHRNEFNSFNLADDLMEPYRPLMDYWINTKVKNEKDYLSYESRIKIIEFMNQKILINNKKMTIDNSMQELISSFISGMELDDVNQITQITLDSLIGAES